MPTPSDESTLVGVLVRNADHGTLLTLDRAVQGWKETLAAVDANHANPQLQAEIQRLAHLGALLHMAASRSAMEEEKQPG